jgi:hypothetical protein
MAIRYEPWPMSEHIHKRGYKCRELAFPPLGKRINVKLSSFSTNEVIPYSNLGLCDTLMNLDLSTGISGLY